MSGMVQGSCHFLNFSDILIRTNSRGQPYVTLSLLSTANATALPATSGARGTECYRRSVSIVSLVVGMPFAPCPREFYAHLLYLIGHKKNIEFNNNFLEQKEL